jgi:hypothetical protein
MCSVQAVKMDVCGSPRLALQEFDQALYGCRPCPAHLFLLLSALEILQSIQRTVYS